MAETAMLPAEGHAKPSGRMRKIVLFSILVVLSVSAGFSTGWPQRKAMILAARYILDVEVDLIGITSIGAVHIDEVRVYDTKSDRRANWPAFVARGVEVNYTLFPQDGRYLNEIDIDSVHATLDATDPSDTNYDFIDAVLARETDAGETDLRFFPESVNLRYIHGEFMSEDGYVVVDGLGLASDFFGPETLNAHFSSEACSGSWRSTESGEVVHVSEGYVDIRAAIGRERIEAEILVAMPGLLEAEGNAGVDVDGESFGAASLQFSTLRVHGEALSVIGHSLLPLPIAFGLLDVSGLSVVADLSADRVFPEAEFTGRVAALEVGEPGHTLFSGNVSIEGTAASGDTHTATARATFAGGHAIEAVLSATGAQAGLRASFEGWSKEAVEETAPADLRPTLEALDYETLGGVFAVAWDDPTYIVSGNLQTSGSGAGEAIHLTAFGEGSLEAGPLFSGDVSARLGASSVTAKARVDSASDFSVTATLDKVEAAPWGAFLAQAEMPEGFHGELFGTLDLVAKQAEGMEVESKVAFRPFGYGDVFFEEVDIAATIATSEDLGKIRFDPFRVEADGLAADLSLNGVLGGDARFDGSWVAQLDLAALGPLAGLDELWGEVESSGTFTMAGDAVNANVEASAPFLGYGEFSTPSDTPLSGAATAGYRLDAGTGDVRDLDLRLGESANVQSSAIHFDTNALRIWGPLAIESDFYPAVAMEFLPEAEGSLKAKANLDYNEDGLRLDWEASVRADLITLPEEAGFVYGLSFLGGGAYDGELEGKGTVSAERVTAAGAQVMRVKTPFVLQGEDFIATELAASVFNGHLSGRASMGILNESFPIRFNTQFESIDLAQLTREVQPPSVELTGIAGGSAVIGYSVAGLSAFTVDAYADQDFTLNRSMVEQVLQTDQFREMLGSDRVEKALAKFLGDAPQRPFDSASLHLDLVDDRIEGEARLKSEKIRAYNGLNMDIELKIDPGALGEALKMLEEGSISNVEF